MARELLEQKKELAEVKSMVVKKAEHEAMMEGIQEQGAENTEKVIRAVGYNFYLLIFTNFLADFTK